MCGIFGYFGDDPAPPGALGRMGCLLRHRGPDSSGTLRAGRAGIGERRLAVTGSRACRPPFLSCGGRIALVHNGEAYNHAGFLGPGHRLATDVDSEAIAHLLEGGPQALGKIDGPYALAWIAEKRDLFLARDPLGEKPLFVSPGPAGSSFMFASERKALPAGAQRVPAGATIMNGEVVGMRGIRVPERSRISKVPSLIEAAVMKRVRGLGRVHVAFSGGLDSSLVAMLAARHTKVTCVVCACEGAPDFEAAEKGARLLNLPLRKVEMKPDGKLFSQVARAIETQDRMQVEIAAPLYSLCRALGPRVLLTGQGADELFLGYARYYQGVTAQQAGGASLDDVRNIGERNCERDDMAAMAGGTELRAPFLDLVLVGAALSIPAGVRSSDPVLRKAVLRQAARKLGLPKELSLAPKKAIQYSSGAHAAFGKR